IQKIIKFGELPKNIQSSNHQVSSQSEEKIQNILLEYQHSSEYATVSLLPSENIPVLKLYLDLYYDDFGTYQNIYHSLESGQLMNIQGQEYWVIASLGVVIADLPQGNDLASVKRHSANKGYQTCQVSKEHSTNNDLDFKN
ncbi:4976_t:CDS:2, partial [Gigaspora margarita]